jgi:hypothetical protein
MPPKAFKPPRPSTSGVKKTTNPKSTTVRKSTSSATSISKPRSSSNGKSKDKGSNSGSNGPKVPRISGLPSLSPDSQLESGDDSFVSEAEVDSPINPIEIDSADAQAAEEERKEGIPPDLLTRLLHENFKEEGTRLSRDASRAVGKYMETFVREALARAAFARVEIEEQSGAGDGFLEVEDLEKLAPQLLMDF